MKTLQVELPDKLAAELVELVKAGWFRDEQELIRYVLTEFVHHNQLELTEQYQMEDIEWALGEAKRSRPQNA